jgi:hypothetical protein
MEMGDIDGQERQCKQRDQDRGVKPVGRYMLVGVVTHGFDVGCWLFVI